MGEQLVNFMGISEVASSIANGRISPLEVMDAILQRIEVVDPHLNSYIQVIDTARKEAQVAQELVERGKTVGPLHGIPLSVKDLMLTRGTPTTAGTKIYGEGLTGGDALLVRRLRQAGAILVAKANLHECAFGVTSENVHFGPVHNPWDLERVPGGSSGGSAASVAAGLCYGSIGSDTRGSIRIPAACCGITGLKPTLHLVPMKGVVPLSSTLDHVGPLTRSVEDAALLLEVLTGGSRNYLESLKKPITSLRLGICSYYFENLEPELERAVQKAIEIFQDEGVEVLEIEMKFLEKALEASDVISRAEAVTYHDPYLREKPEAIGRAVRERIETGYAVTGMEYVKAQQNRYQVIEEFKQLFKKLDVLVAPALPTLPPRIGQNVLEVNGQEESVVHALVRFTAPQNVAGIPALVIPCGFSSSGLPIGLQLIAGHRKESILFQLGSFFQQATNWHLKRPELQENR